GPAGVQVAGRGGVEGHRGEDPELVLSAMKRAAVAVPALLPLLLAAGCRSTRQPEEPVSPHVRVLSYNVNWGVPRPDLAVEIIRDSGADIVCLQETTPEWEDLLRRALGRDYLLAEFRSSSGPRAAGGLAFLS